MLNQQEWTVKYYMLQKENGDVNLKFTIILVRDKD